MADSMPCHGSFQHPVTPANANTTTFWQDTKEQYFFVCIYTNYARTLQLSEHFGAVPHFAQGVGCLKENSTVRSRQQTSHNHLTVPNIPVHNAAGLQVEKTVIRCNSRITRG
jgi:hypothetical protein